MARKHIDHKNIAEFAQNRVNLPKAKADEYRNQARRLREKVENYLHEHDDFSLRKMITSGSLSKGTALRSLNDIDMACYVSGTDTPSEIPKLLNYITEKLQKAFPNFTADQINPQTYSIIVSFKGSGLDVDIVPILYYGEENWYGNLINQDNNGAFLKTSIPLHLDFIRKRKEAHKHDFSQVVRLAKFWARKEKNEKEGFRFKSFMIELILAKLSDQGVDFSDYPEALQSFFTYIARTNMRELIIFNDYYSLGNFVTPNTPIKIIDPVNINNNVSEQYTDSQADMIVEAALNAGDAIGAALTATRKQDTIYYWQKVFGTIFQV